jgi:hypothetical protein
VTPKERRDRLFKNGKPLVRKLSLLNGEGYSKDAAILWAAYKAGSFSLPPDLTQEQFIEAMEAFFSRFAQVWIVDDKNPSFSGKQGQVGLVFTNMVEMIVDAQFGYFKWATKRNILRSTASFLNMIKNSSKTGICMVRTEKRTLCDHLKDYDLLYYVGRSSEKEYLYSIRGRGS